jgi:hypothetical protein
LVPEGMAPAPSGITLDPEGVSSMQIFKTSISIWLFAYLYLLHSYMPRIRPFFGFVLALALLSQWLYGFKESVVA